MGMSMLAGCASQLGTPEGGGAAAASEPAPLPVTAKFDPQPIAAPVVRTPEPVASRCDFTVTLKSDEIFEHRKGDISPDGSILLAHQVMAPLAGCRTLELVTVTGFTDRLQPAQLRQTLSEKHAETVKAFLVSRGVPSARVSAVGEGSGSSIATACPQVPHHELVACLAPDRRLVIDVKGIAR
jgi:OOP family OmpA-OmpF porin